MIKTVPRFLMFIAIIHSTCRNTAVHVHPAASAHRSVVYYIVLEIIILRVQ